ncbi:Rpn family recombination-promoting nuclease/putative transposase [uncultured Candidatus Kuenenia sp.]|uniref:Rpn family recombination-promoting nuclease/putative transposase n=1 Tax=uncultured Candidatus Kuenenia sp. TaxID=1048336 RepID=UPI002600FB8D|nr:Rpn family recombination-promoting nuclease/putative transposase [uncultured Candidatus Kuenenia sp.]
MEIINPHDKFFKETFSIRENVIDFLSGTFPSKILKKLDLSTLTQDNNSYIDEEHKEHFSDIVYTCFCKDKELRITLLFEHKSYAVACPYLQLMKYLLKIWESNNKQAQRLMPVIPVILYHGKDTWKARRFRDYFEGIDEEFLRVIPEFEYLLTDLSSYSNEEIKDRVFRRASLQITMLLMRNIYNDKILGDKLKVFFEIGRQYFEEEGGVKFLESVIRYLYYASDIEEERVIDTLKEISEEGGKLSMTIAARLIEKGKITGRMEGRMEGREEGRAEGAIEGERKGRIEGLIEAIEIGLELKYGVNGLRLLERIRKIAVIEKLESIKEAVKISKNMEEIEKLL